LGVPLAAAITLVAAMALTGCGTSQDRGKTPAPPREAVGLPRDLVRESRPIGRGPRFQPRVTGPIPGRCLPRLGHRSGVHLEAFAENRVVIVPAGIGTRAPRTFFAGRIAGARCYGALVTIDTTGLLLIRPGARLTVGDLFRAWGQPLSEHRLASFTSPHGSTVSVFIGGVRTHVSPGSVPLTPHAEIVLEVGPYVPPHASYTFPPAT
jgi:hypothetical protein